MTAPAPGPVEGTAADGRPSVHPETPEQWHAWLREHHARGSGVWVVQWKRHTGRPALDYEEQVVEALAWGWIDSTAGTVDADRSRMWFAPRRVTSGWSRPNKVRVERLHAEGRMQPAGQRAIDLAHENGSWTLLDDVENLVVPDDLAAALAGRPGAREHWDAFPPSARKQMLAKLVLSKKAETRGRWVETIADGAAGRAGGLSRARQPRRSGKSLSQNSPSGRSSPVGCRSASDARSSTRRILPLMVLGSSPNSSRRSRLYGARCSRE